MRRILILAAFTICAGALLSCSLINGQKVEETKDIFVKNRYPEYESKENELSESDIEELKWLIQTLHVSHGSASNRVGKGGVLDTVEKQAWFLEALNEEEYEKIIKDRLGEYVTFENDKKLINRENAKLVLEMAGASEIEMTDVWSYFLENKRYYVESEEIFELPRYSRTGSEYFSEFTDWIFIAGEDGKLTVRYKTYIPALRGYIEKVELKLHKNDKSIFGGYSTDCMLVVPVEPEGMTFAQEEFCHEDNWGEYSRPLMMGDSIDDYIFKLDGSLYQMPFPLDELMSNGWEYAENLKKDEKRAEITLTKEGKKISCILWNYQGKSAPKWYVVNLKTESGKGILDVDFELFANRKRGDYAYGYGVHGMYGFWDPLCGLGFGVRVYDNDDKTIQDFEMTYAPKYTDRIKRLKEISADVKEELNVTETGRTELERDVSYKLTMYDEPIYVQVKSLDKIGWAKDTNIIWVKKGSREEIIGYIEYGMSFTLSIAENKEAKIEVLRMEDGPDDEPEVLIVREAEK